MAVCSGPVLSCSPVLFHLTALQTQSVNQTEQYSSVMKSVSVTSIYQPHGQKEKTIINK